MMPLPNCKKIKKTALLCLYSSVTIVSPLTAVAQVQVDESSLVSQESASHSPVSLSSNTLTYDEINQIVTAEGAVEFEQDGQIVKATKVSYDLQRDIVKAIGDVVLVDQNGDVHFSEEIELEKDMSDGWVKELKSLLADGSRFTAEYGERIGGQKIKMKKGTYTPCEVCELPDGSEGQPAWQLKARNVTHDKETKKIAYDDATFELFGTPIFYTPYFSHPDGTEDKKSGFLPPSFSAGTNQGFGVTSQYYWDIAPSLDATIGATVYSSDAPLLLGEIRKRYDNATLEFSSGVTYSDKNGVVDDKEARGHLFGTGLWNIDEKWRAGLDIAYASDDQYMRQYDITSEDVLENQIYIERFDNRNYAAARTLYFQDIRVQERDADQPHIAPELEASFLGNPNGMLGGRWSTEFSSLGLVRDGSGQDSYRISSGLGWQRRHIAPVGIINTLDVSLRGDVYAANDLQSGEETETRDGRVFPTIHWKSQLPLSKPVTDKTTAVIEPIVAVAARTNLNENSDIPNEDSQDVQIDASNLFEVDRFPGFDRVEDQSHITYGVRGGLFENNGSKIEAFIGQSYRFSDDDDVFPRGSGLEEQSSDFVGDVSLDYKKDYSLDYRFQFGSEDLNSKRHELDADASFSIFDLNTRYLYAKALEGTDISEDREQINTVLTTHIDDDWYLTTGLLYDLGDNEGLRKSQIGLGYEGQCLSLAATMQRNLTAEEAGENSTEFFVTIGLKNLGQFEGGQ